MLNKTCSAMSPESICQSQAQRTTTRHEYQEVIVRCTYRPQRLQTQCDNLNIRTFSAETDLKSSLRTSDVILDAVFGFSFKPPIRAPFETALKLISESKLPIVSIDIPSGWDVDEGNINGFGLEPSVLVSLTAPKSGSKHFKGRHFLGGRFVPW